MTTLLPPNNYEAECALVGGILIGGSDTYKSIAEYISADDLYDRRNKIVYHAIERVHESGLEIDVVTVGEQLQRSGELDELSDGAWSGNAYLTGLLTHGSLEVSSYAVIVKELSLKRQYIQMAGKIAEWSYNGRKPLVIARDVVETFSKFLTFTNDTTEHVSAALSRAFDMTERASRGENIGVRTGLADIDNLLGSLLPKNLYLVAGRPGTGKTAFVLTVARNAAKAGKRVCIISLEMSNEQVSWRLAAQEGNINLQKLVHGSLDANEWTRYAESVEKVGRLPIHMNDTTSLTVGKISDIVRRNHSEHGIDLLIVDYIQLAAGDKTKYERRDLEISDISRGLKNIAGELNIPVLAAAQLSRAVEQRAEKRPMLSDLRESGSLEQDAYGVMFLWRDNDIKNNHVVHYDVAKHRNGPVGEGDLYFAAEYTRFDNLARKQIE